MWWDGRTFAATLIPGGTDLVRVADLLGHARLDTGRGYTRPTADDRAKALDLLPTGRRPATTGTSVLLSVYLGQTRFSHSD